MAQFGTMKPSEVDAAVRILLRSFAGDPNLIPKWLARAGTENVRALRDGGELLALLIEIPMGQFFLGRSVPLVGIAGVGTAPEARGRGVATDLMKRTLRGLRRRGVALSTLYPAVQSLYRRVGYEIAGSRFETRARTRALGDGDRRLSLQRYEAKDGAAVRSVYRRSAAHRTGYLDRGPYVWNRVLQPRGEPAEGYLVVEKGHTAGYFFASVKPASEGTQTTTVFDAAALSEAARRRILTALGDRGSLSRETVFKGALRDEFQLGLEQSDYTVRLEEYWMLRIVDLEAALSERGYPRAVQGELHLHVDDDILAANRGRWVLTVAGGRGQVRKGGRGTLRVDIRALSQLYSSFASAEELVPHGTVQGTPRAIALSTSLFAGPSPSTRDFF
ncbi:MAG: GNAT family N-acetyltransferase [Myxococcota bacterium]